MKKILFLSLLLFPLAPAFSQDILYANDSHTMTLFFPSPIRQAVTGAEHFTFSYNREAGQHFGLLQANKDTDSNLLVLTQDGRVYSYHLEYRKDLSETFRFVTTTESIGKETETKTLEKTSDSTLVPKTMEIPRPNPTMELWKKGAEYVLARKTKTLKSNRKNGMVLRLKELFYHGNEVYMEVEIHNRSAIDFELDVLETYKVNGKKGRRSSHQKVLLVPQFEYSLPEIVRVGQRCSFIYVLPKFTLGDSEKLLLELQEQKGGRMLQLYNK